MTTAQDLINSSAKQAGILAEGQSLEGGVNADALKRLNRMIARLKNSGIDLGLSTLIAGDVLYIDDADEEALELGLTMRLMTRHRRPIDAGIAGANRSALVELQAKYSVRKEMALDSTLTHKGGINNQSFNINNG